MPADQVSGATADLAAWAAEAQASEPPSGVDVVVRRSLLDWLGCALAGSSTASARVAREVVLADGAAPVATVIATSARTSATNAALVNGTAGHAHDFDDSGAHPASYLTPTVLALAETLGSSGREVVTAWAVGFEVASRMGSALRAGPGWHSTSVRGTLGAAAAAGSLLGLDAAALTTTLGIAASQASGLMRNFGTSTKSWHPAHAARCGIEAARLAAAGFSAADDILEARYGYLDCFGAGRSDVGAVTDGLGEQWHVLVAEPEIKAWPTCSSNHPVLTLLESLLAGSELPPDDIVRIDHWGTVEPGAGSLQYTRVNSGLQGKFCLEYNIAAMVLDGRVDYSTFTDENSRRPDLRALMDRVHRHQHQEPGQRLRIELADGRVHDLPVGRRRTLRGDEVVTKFRANADPVVGATTAAEIVGAVNALEVAGATTEIMSRLVVA